MQKVKYEKVVDRVDRNTNNHNVKHPKSNEPRKVWRPANINGRSYKEVINPNLEVVMDVLIDKNLEKRLKNAYVCYLKDGVFVRRVAENIGEKEWTELVISRFDSFACIISKVNKENDEPIEEDKVDLFKSYFKEVKP